MPVADPEMLKEWSQSDGKRGRGIGALHQRKIFEP